jgi:hypothetical protein
MSGLAFLNPMLLAGVFALPLIWWLLRTVPPAPKRIEFPATRILVGIEDKEKQSEKTPWWLTAIRMLAAALMIFALAEPVLNPIKRAAIAGNGPIAIVIDNGWASGARWSERQAQMERLIAEAEQQGRNVVIAPTARVARFATLKIENAAQARSASAAVQPYPHAPERSETAASLTEALKGQSGVSLYWIADGIDHDGKARAFADSLASLARGGSATLIELGAGQEPLAVSANLGQGGRLEAQVFRAEGQARQGSIHALSSRGQRLSEAKFTFAPAAPTTSATFELPLELRNQVARIEIAGERSAGGVHLLDARSQWHRIGLLSGTAREQAQPLLAPLYYLERALLPFAELAKSEDANLLLAIESLIKRNISVLMLADIGTLPRDIRDKLDLWVKKGGVLVRFAGPRLEQGGDDLIAAPLRTGGRQLGGALSWSTPQPLSAFDETSLFAGLTVPAEVLVTRQVLADPARLTNSDIKSWARLKDGTPLVTATKRGEGQLVLFHVTANSDWSNLPLSGLFIDMLRRVATLGKAGGVSLQGEANTNTAAEQAADTADVLPPFQTLDGFGILKAPPPTAQSIAATKINEATPTAENPPGYYGPQGSPRALNLAGPKTVLKPLPTLPAPFERRAVDTAAPRPLKPALLSSALALVFADIIATLALAGAFMGLGRAVAKRTAGALMLAILAGSLVTSPADAQFQDRRIDPFRDQSTGQRGFTQQLGRPRIPTPVPTDPAARSQMATGKVTFGYVLSGDANTDRAAEQGLRGLNTFLLAKTAVDPGEPMGVNIRTDEIAFFPFLYWPVPANAQALPDPVLAKIDAYMKNGGMIVFDTRDAGTSFMPGGFNRQADRSTPLQRLLGTLDIPRLEAVPEAHVLTKSFYLLKQFPGRYDNGQLWVEAEAPADSGRARQSRRVDGVSSILVTSNDFASAWALDDRNVPLFPVVPGGDQQREMAFRVGVNIVMYALTGNYKADQVHIPALLERLGN